MKFEASRGPRGAAEPAGNDAAEAAPAVPTPGSWGHLLGGCGAGVAAARGGSFDIVVVDAADGGNAPTLA